MTGPDAAAAGPAAGALRVLVVEDDARMLEILTRHLDRLGYAVRGAPGGGQALQRLAEGPADVVLSDVRMPGLDGRSLLQVVRERFPDVKVVLMTAFGSVDDAVEAMKAGAYTYLTKPFKIEEVATVLRGAAREVAQQRQATPPASAPGGRWTPDRLIGTSARMQEVRRALREAAEVGATVLITGRSGTGKEVAARAIHFSSRQRAAGAFVPVNCAAIPESLFESAMFGHRRGAFTGAHANQVGFAEQSSGGTLFLDEVGDIPLPQQAKLLRMLQESELTPIGATRPVKVDLRVIAATNRDLEAMVRQGEFREDLFYRLNVLRIDMPELAERAGDVPALADHLLVEIATANQIPAPGFTREALESLARRRWPGNVRELRNALERALLSARGRLIDAKDLPAAGAQVGLEEPARRDEPLTLADAEKLHIEKVLALCRWNRSAAAKLMGIDRRTLFSKIQRHGLIGPLRGTGEAADEAEDEPEQG